MILIRVLILLEYWIFLYYLICFCWFLGFSLFKSFEDNESLSDINSYIKNRLKNEIKQIELGGNKEIEKRYQRYIDYGLISFFNEIK